MKVTRDLEPRSRTSRLLRRRASSDHPSRRAGDVHMWDHHHRNVQGGGARAAVFGVSDGLVTNVSLILGFAGANAGPSVVRLAGVSLLIAGAFSMASGEWTSMSAQRELLERELAMERHEISHRPEGERRELVGIYERRGVDPSVARTLADEMMRTPELALETHAREELGINPGALGRPLQAALSSFVTFGVGALIPLLPWFVTRGKAAMWASVVLGVLAAVGVGAALAAFTRRSWLRSSFRQLLMTALPAAVTYGVGALIGIGVH
ncbi:MAG: VIT1/CCC1 transporter family protein [Acidimicrobiales bacterium]|nr:VIT1/CCC1 transporter family protein [Acidimicrobiales bacterium]